MADSPQTENKAATVADQFLHKLIFDVAARAAEAEIIAIAPIMGAPIIKQLDEEAIKFVCGKIYESLAKGVTFTIIDAQTNKEAADANVAKDALKAALQGSDQNAIDQASKDFDQAFEKLVHSDGLAHP